MSPLLMFLCPLLSSSMINESRKSSVFCSSSNNHNGDGNENPLEKLQKYITENFPTESADELAKLAGSKITDIVSTGIPGEISYGFVTGFCAGFSLKKIGKMGALCFGASFIFIQSLSYGGYIDVNTDKISKDALQILDVNDDGKFDEKDVESMTKKVMEILQYNLPSGGGFVSGMIMGVRSG
eukprot:CAMPEP_0113314466 /NCGR_PEP_ID=MMETSP0010_2-20120614/10514_1 /TAXON_ID=216773 ORGANISM="Corethron hystrix, Strain 308" /NCGR_SAMPLE_ID=MMETSP0010_2 /ASSEMBLY_ACC=CAM_ASM_000155 /LENGTH=182 /DNA_ID=CAMNT_0000170755 /DNA_START=266 /DNA_END=814 /DNA_ORIENTATION=- /assembly_acc=CAM_ASM_000155